MSRGAILEQGSSADPAAKFVNVRREVKKIMLGLKEDVVEDVRPHRHKGLNTQTKS